jgi:murein DD-endopeptidase MepM/ murein hydrolase activator NlpD
MSRLKTKKPIQILMDNTQQLAHYLDAHPEGIGKVVDFDATTDRLYQLDLTADNTNLDAATITDTPKFCAWVNKQLEDHGCQYGVGGYWEHRTIYKGIPLFDNGIDEPRFLHLGVDIWAAAGTPVYAPLCGKIHSFNDNDNIGDYGPAIILEHDANGLTLYSLYGHLGRKNLRELIVGQTITVNQQIGNLGDIHENGCWPPHLHFQLMFDMEGKQGDYPGACRFSEQEKYRKNIPDPQLLLRFPGCVNQ